MEPEAANPIKLKYPLDNKSRVEKYIKQHPLEGVIFCDFENTEGPRIVHSIPEIIISNVEFTSVRTKLFRQFKSASTEKIVTIVTESHKIISCCMKNLKADEEGGVQESGNNNNGNNVAEITTNNSGSCGPGNLDKNVNENVSMDSNNITINEENLVDKNLAGNQHPEFLSSHGYEKEGDLRVHSCHPKFCDLEIL